jgi:menaquinone-9 beta-reductase
MIGAAMETCDVLIVGGGPAGSSCAWRLRRAGVNVVVLDKAQFPRHKVCAGWITPPIAAELKLDLDDFQSSRVLQPITRFLTGVIDGPEIETVYGRTVSYGIRRCEFDDYLLRRSGATLKLGEAFHSMRRDGSDWIVNDAIRAPIVIGAGGHFCPVARFFATSNGRRSSSDEHKLSDGADLPVVLAQEVEFEMTEAQRTSCSIRHDRPELFFCPDLKGYGWVFRKGDYLNVGLGREGEEHLSTHVADFVQFLARRHKIAFELPDRFHGHAYRLRTKLAHSSPDDGVLLIGDALGLADRQSGEGIRPSIESGLMAAKCITEASGARRSDLSELYAAKLEARFRDGRSGATVAHLLPAAIRQFAARRLMASRWFTRRFLLDRWFLHVNDPPLSDI